MNVITATYTCDAGNLRLGDYEGRLCLCDWINSPHAPAVARRLERRLGKLTEGSSPLIDEARRQLDEYFSGMRKEFDIETLAAGTPFQQSVWRALCEVDYGATLSYGELAARIGCPTGVRAVAAAVGANAISIIIPCHRIVGSDGSLTGYAGGLPAKSLLLSLERLHTLNQR